MKIKAGFALYVRLVLLAVLCGVTAVLWSGARGDAALDVIAWMREERTPVDAETMRSTALHESSHIVVSAALRGMQSLQQLKVYAQIIPNASSRLLGRSFVRTDTRVGFRTDALDVAAMFYAGGIGERALGGKDDDSDNKDTHLANMVVRAYREGTPVQTDGLYSTDDPEKAALLIMDNVAAAACAQALIEKNGAAIAALADEVLAQPERFYRRVLDAGQLADFFAAHPVTKAPEACTFE